MILFEQFTSPEALDGGDGASVARLVVSRTVATGDDATGGR
jgi:hypothetical protein